MDNLYYISFVLTSLCFLFGIIGVVSLFTCRKKTSYDPMLAHLLTECNMATDNFVYPINVSLAITIEEQDIPTREDVDYQCITVYNDAPYQYD